MTSLDLTEALDGARVLLPLKRPPTAVQDHRGHEGPTRLDSSEANAIYSSHTREAYVNQGGF